jgi:hypothetical protein
MQKENSRKWDFVLCVLGAGLVVAAFGLCLTISGSPEALERLAEKSSPPAVEPRYKVFPVKCRGIIYKFPVSQKSAPGREASPEVADTPASGSGLGAKVGEESIYAHPHVPGELLVEFSADAAKVLNRTRRITREIDLLSAAEVPELDRVFMEIDVTSLKSTFSGHLSGDLGRFFHVAYAAEMTVRRTVSANSA